MWRSLGGSWWGTAVCGGVCVGGAHLGRGGLQREQRDECHPLPCDHGGDVSVKVCMMVGLTGHAEAGVGTNASPSLASLDFAQWLGCCNDRLMCRFHGCVKVVFNYVLWQC